MEKRCPDCGEPVSGRKDKKFCSDQCRINFNNQKNAQANIRVRSIQKILLQNRSILNNFIRAGKHVCNMQQLLSAGFRFDFHTQILKKGHKVYFCVYDLAFNFSAGRNIQIKNIGDDPEGED